MTDFQQMLEQHLQVVAHADRLDALTRDEAKGLPHARAKHLLVSELQTLREGLVRHFAAEEEDGYFTSVRADRPDLDRKIDALQQQHTTLRTQLDDLVARAAHARLDMLREEVVDFLRNLREHEAGERSLVQDSALQDVGFAD